MGKASKDKGYRGENEFAKLIPGAKRVPLSGAQEGYENDVLIPWQGKTIKAEVKRRKSGFKTLYEWVEDEREKPDIVALRTDRNQWLVTMTLDKFLELIGAKLEES